MSGARLLLCEAVKDRVLPDTMLLDSVNVFDGVRGAINHGRGSQSITET